MANQQPLRGICLGGGFAAPPAAAPTDASKAPAAPLFGGLNTTAPGGDATKTAGFAAATPAPAATTAADDSKKIPTFSLNTKAAPAATGGGGAPTTPAPAGGFSFGGAAAAPAATGGGAAAPAAAGGFSFAANTATKPPTTPADSKAPATPNTPATPAPVATPVVPAVPGGAQTPAGTPAPVATPEVKPLNYQTLTVEQILNKFQKELEKDAMDYIDQAKRVCEYDAVLRDSQRDLAQIATQTQRLLLEQQQVEKALEGIGAFQDELESTLSQVEGNVDELFARQSHLAPQDADFERERAYATASTIDRRLEELKENMVSTAGQINSANERAFSGEVANIVAILNKHQDGLSSLQNAARRIDNDASNISRMLQNTRF